ncbi:MAG: hypothetical protein IJ649_02645 [Oscillospiraceae bacterium]|nr:hypothetical protein [Oscillospiraceae bacterium]
MITCKLGEKTYHIDFVSGRALREIDAASKMYNRILKMTDQVTQGETPEDVNKAGLSTAEALDVMVKWFCLLFGNQFTPDEFYDGYPADRMMIDIPLALLAVQTQTTEVLSEFPTKPTAETEMSA